MFEFLRRDRASHAEHREAIPVSDPRIAEVFGGLLTAETAAGEPVTVDSAMSVPAVWAAVNFIAGTLAGLPLQVFQRKGEGREKVGGPIAAILHDAVNDELSSFDWRKHMFEQVLTYGRGLTYIERNAAGRVINLFPIDPTTATIRRERGRTTYTVKSSGSKAKTYKANEIIDLAFMLSADGVKHRGPIERHKDTISLAIAATKYGGRYFQGGGVPPFAVTGNFQTPKAMQRASEDLAAAVRKSAKEKRHALTLPAGLDIKSIGVDPSKSQFIETRRFLIEEVARIYSLPPTFLQDLTNGTFSNTEQQDLHFVKHTLKRWVEQFEQELNLKLFGRRNNRRFAELNIDGIQRGDFSTRMSGYATGIQNAIWTPNEVRRRENLPDVTDADQLLIQGATVPLGAQPKAPESESNDD